MPTPYELDQLRRIARWRDTPPDLVTQAFGRALSPAAQAVQRAIPADWLKSALDQVQRTAAVVADRRSILDRAGVTDLSALRTQDLARCDQVAGHVRRRGTAMAGGTGAVFGVAGAAGMIADVPTLLVQTFRVIHRTGLCYGEDCSEDIARLVPIAVFAMASANTLDEKRDALAALEHDVSTRAAAVRDGLERTAERELAKEAAVFSLTNLAGAFTRRMGLRKAGSAVPVIGALVGGAVNAWYLNEVAEAAKVGFQLRWLQQRYRGTTPEAFLALPAARDGAA